MGKGTVGELWINLRGEEKGKNKMRDYHSYSLEHIGSSDIAALTLTGCTKESEIGIKTELLTFGEDGNYKAYIVDEDAIIGEHYKLMYEFDKWLKIYDDDELVRTISADHIKVYRAKEMGCVIQKINNRKEN